MIAAIVVGFFPDYEVLDKLLLNLTKQVDYLFFIDNGGGDRFLEDLPLERSDIRYVNLNGNKGLGFALNEGFKLAANLGCEYVITFDQDSAPPDSLVPGLLDAHYELQAKNMNCAAVGPVFFDRRADKKNRFPFYKQDKGSIKALPTDQAEGLLEVDVLITSGMLIKTSVWIQGIQYDPGLFVDYTDTDWCFRARAAGYKLYGCLSQEMGHALSDAPPVKLFGLSFFEYSPVRRYYYFRNTIIFIRQKYVSFPWKFRLGIGLFMRFFSSLLIDKRKVLSFKMMCLGVWDGVLLRDGALKLE